MSARGPFRFAYDKGFQVEQRDDTTLVISFGRRWHWVWLAITLPLLIPMGFLGLFGLGLLIRNMPQLLAGANLLELLAGLLFLLTVLAGLGLLSWLSFTIVSEILQEVGPRTLRYDAKNREVSVGNFSFLRRTVRADDIESTDILTCGYGGRPWGYLVIRIRGRNTWLRLMEVAGVSASTQDEVADALQPIADTVAQLLDCPRPWRTEVSPFTLLKVWGR